MREGILVSENAVRSLVRELLYQDSPAVVNELPYQDFDAPLESSPETDTTYRAYDNLYSVPIGTVLVPHDKKELEIALRSFLEKVPDSDVPKLYHSIQRAFDEVAAEEGSEGQEIHMAKQMKQSPMTSNVEESIRRQIRKIMIESGLSYSGPDTFAGSGDEDDGPLKRKRDINIADTSDASKLTYPQLVKKKRDLKSKMSGMSAEERSAAERDLGDTETREMSHGEMVDDLDVDGPSGVKREEHLAIEKAKYLSQLGENDPAKLKALMDTARHEYIDFLASGGDLSDEEVDTLDANPGAVESLDGYREWLDAYIWDGLENDDPVHYIPAKDYDAVRADKLAKGITPAYPKGPKGEPVHKKVDWKDKQYARASASTKDREKDRERETKQSKKAK